MKEKKRVIQIIWPEMWPHSFHLIFNFNIACIVHWTEEGGENENKHPESFLKGFRFLHLYLLFPPIPCLGIQWDLKLFNIDENDEL